MLPQVLRIDHERVWRSLEAELPNRVNRSPEDQESPHEGQSAHASDIQHALTGFPTQILVCRRISQEAPTYALCDCNRSDSPEYACATKLIYRELRVSQNLIISPQLSK
jgi:hypothetical protein